MITLSVGAKNANRKSEPKAKASRPKPNPQLTAYRATRSRLLNAGMASDHPRLVELDRICKALEQAKPLPEQAKRRSTLDLDKIENADQARRHVAALRATRTRREREGADPAVINSLKQREAEIAKRFPEASRPKVQIQKGEEEEVTRADWVARHDRIRDEITAAIDRIRAKRCAKQAAKKAA